MTSRQAPIICELGTDDARGQLLEWADLQQQTLRSTAVDSGVEMIFPSSLAEEIAELIEREAACCGFLDLVSVQSGDEVAVTITSDDPEAFAVIAALSGVSPS